MNFIKKVYHFTDDVGTKKTQQRRHLSHLYKNEDDNVQKMSSTPFMHQTL